MGWQKVRARNVSVLVNACSRFPVGRTSQASSAMPKFVSRWCFVDCKFPFAWCLDSFLWTDHAPPARVNMFSVMFEDQPFRTSLLALVLRFLIQLRGNLQILGHHSWFGQFLVHKWCLHLPSKTFLCIFLNTGFPDRPSSSTESIFLMQKCALLIPGHGFNSYFDLFISTLVPD